MPFAPFSKNERLGKVADFGSFTRSSHHRSGRGGAENAELQYLHNAAEDKDFQLVDNSRIPKSRGARRGGRRFIARPERPPTDYEEKIKQSSGKVARELKKDLQKRTRRRRGARGRYRRPGNAIRRDPSVQIGSNWLQLEYYELQQLNELSLDPPTPRDVCRRGELQRYNRKFDTMKSQSRLALRKTDAQSYFVTASDDPVMQDLAIRGVGNVFATDSVLSHLMTCARSVYPWDLVFTCIGSCIFIEPRDPFRFDIQTVHETAVTPPGEDDPTDINGEDQLAMEATAVELNYSQQVLESKKATVEDIVGTKDEGAMPVGPNPFLDEDDAKAGKKPASLLYRYREFDLGDGIQLVARTTVHGYQERRSRAELLSIHALHEWDPKKMGNKSLWSKTIDSTRGGIFLDQMKNNGFRIAKWAAQSVLAGVDVMKVGFVSRKAVTQNTDHRILAGDEHNPKEILTNLQLNTNNMFGILKWAIRTVQKYVEEQREVKDAEITDPDEDEEAYKFVLVREPNQDVLRFYTVPADAFEEEEGEKDDWDDEDEGSEDDREDSGRAGGGGRRQ